jgi:hypothetical protein
MVASVRNKSITHARDVREHFKPAGDEMQSFVDAAVRPHSAKFAKIGAKLPVFSWHTSIRKPDPPEVFPRNPVSAPFSPQKRRSITYFCSTRLLPFRVCPGTPLDGNSRHQYSRHPVTIIRHALNMDFTLLVNAVFHVGPAPIALRMTIPAFVKSP